MANYMVYTTPFSSCVIPLFRCVKLDMSYGNHGDSKLTLGKNLNDQHTPIRGQEVNIVVPRFKIYMPYVCVLIQRIYTA